MLNTTQLQTLASELETDPVAMGYASLLAASEYEAIAALLNDREPIPNPAVQESTPKRITWNEFLSLIAPAEMLAMYGDYGDFARDLREVLTNNERDLIPVYWAALETKLTQPSIDAILAKFNETEPDPAYSDTILEDSRATVLGLPRVQGADVQAIDQGFVS